MTYRAQDMSGKEFGRWTVVSRIGTTNSGAPLWLCRCACGNENKVASNDLVHSRSKSCGCRKTEASTKHGHAGKVLSPTWRSWRSMRLRCATTSSYCGRKGVTICARWDAFENFLADMGERPTGKSLDRYPNNDGNYEPSNCRWATAKEQCNNKRQGRKVSPGYKLDLPQPERDARAERMRRMNAIRYAQPRTRTIGLGHPEQPPESVDEPYNDPDEHE